jgi:inosine/xanthosine triphosphate pyrophosphatase family protein
MDYLKLIFVAGNTDKLREVRGVLGDAVEVEFLKLDLPEIQGTTQQIGKDKRRRAADIIGFSMRPAIDG